MRIICKEKKGKGLKKGWERDGMSKRVKVQGI